MKNMFHEGMACCCAAILCLLATEAQGQSIEWRRGGGEPRLRKLVQNDSHYFVAAAGLDIYEKQNRTIVASLYKGEDVASCALSMNGLQICVALNDHLAFHSTSDFALVETLPLETTPADLAWSPDGSSIAILSDNGTLSLWNLDEDRIVWSQNIAASSGISSIVDNLRFCNDGRYLVYKAISFGIVRANDGQRVLHNEEPYNVLTPFDVDAASNQIAVAMDSEIIHVLEINNDRADTVAAIRFRGDRVTALLLDGLKSELHVAQSDRISRISSLDGELAIRRAVPGYEIQDLVSFLPRQILLIDGLPGHAWIIESDSLETIETFASYSHVVNQLAWNASGTLLAGADSRTIVFHNVQNGKGGEPISSSVLPKLWDIRDIDFSTDGRFMGVVTGKRLMLWDIEDEFTNVEVDLVPLGRFYQIKWLSATQSFLVTSDSATFICDIINDDISSVTFRRLPVILGGLDVSRRELRAFAIDTSGVLVDVSLSNGTVQDRIEDVALEGLLVDLFVDENDRNVIVVERSGKVTVWDNVLKRNHQTLMHDGGIIASELQPKSNLLITSGYDYRVLVWDLTSGEIVHVLERPMRGTSISCSIDGTRLAVGYEDGLIVYDVPWHTVDVVAGDERPESIATVYSVTGDIWHFRLPSATKFRSLEKAELYDANGRICPIGFVYHPYDETIDVQVGSLLPNHYWLYLEFVDGVFVLPIMLGATF